jgi:adenylate cyclase
MGMKRHIPTLLAAVLAGLWGASLAFSHWSGEISVLDRIEAPLADLRFLIQGQRPAPDLITIIAIDDKTVQESGTYPLPRATVARLIKTVAHLKPTVIALDLLFVDPGPAEGDRALADALGNAPAVLAAAGIFDHSVQFVPITSQDRLERVPTAQRLLLPLKSLGEMAAIGVVNVATDQSGTPRHIPLLLRQEGGLIASFPLRAASVALHQDPIIQPDRISLGSISIGTDLGYALPLRFYGPRGTIRTISASEVLKGRLDEGAVRDRIVVIGATATGGGDVFPTPFDPVLPGAEVLATAIAHLMVGDGLVRDRRVRLADGIMAVIMPVLLVLLLAWRRSVLSYTLIAMAALLWVGLTTAAFFHGIWLSATLPLIAAAPPAVLFGAARLWHDRRRAERLVQEGNTLRRFQPPSLAARLARDPDFLIEPVRQEAALVFIDLSGFTGLSEALGPDRTQALLQGFHDLIDEETVRNQGLVASFMGDGAMILFGLPEPSSQDACHAVEACVSLSTRTRTWLASLPEPISARLSFKVGAHYGTIVASRLGGDSHQHITAIGDTVNVASRLMEVAAAHEVEVALSDELFRAAGTACWALNAGVLKGTIEAPIRGRSDSVATWLWRSARESEQDGIESADDVRRSPGS